MSIEEPPVLPIYIVRGCNFQVEVPIDEFNAEFSIEHQILHAATTAIEVFKNISNHHYPLIMDVDAKQDKASIGTTLSVYLKNTGPDKEIVAFTHIALADAGFYEDSIKMKVLLDQQIVQIEQEEETNNKKLASDLKSFDELKKFNTASKPKKSKKKP